MTFNEIYSGLARNPHLKSRLDKTKYSSILTLGGGPYEYLKEIDAEFKVSIELFKEYALYSTRHTTMTILGDLTKFPFVDFKWDLILLTEVVEHLEKSSAIKLLKEISDKSREIFITTPGRYTVPGSGTDSNIYQWHRSSWSPEDFIGVGYNFIAIEQSGTDIAYVVKKNNDILPSSIPPKPIDILRCPEDEYYPLDSLVFEEIDSRIKTGVLRCQKCGRYYPIKEQLVEMLPDILRDFYIDHSFLLRWENKLTPDFEFRYVR